MIKFEKRTIKVRMKDPRLGFQEKEEIIEIRKDPLTGRICRVNRERALRPHQGTKIISSRPKKCPFCEENVEKLTPMFVEGRERYKLGSSTLFPNLYPYAKHHAVVVVTKKHCDELKCIKEKDLFDSLKNCLEFFRDVCKYRNLYPTVNFNFLQPSGASIIHPHFQIFAEEKPTTFTRILIAKSKAYKKKTGRNFWRELVKEERKRKERFIGKVGCFNWIADFAPIKNNQISAIIDKKISSFLQLKDKHLKDLAKGLRKMFVCLSENGVRSLNMTIFSGGSREDLSDHFLLNLKIASRGLKEHISDIGFLELFHGESVIETLPEILAQKLKVCLNKL